MQMLPIRHGPDEPVNAAETPTDMVRQRLEWRLLERRPQILWRASIPLILVGVASTQLEHPLALRVLMAGNAMMLLALWYCVRHRRAALARDSWTQRGLSGWIACEAAASAMWAAMIFPVTQGHQWGTATLMVCVSVLVHTLVTVLLCSNVRGIRRAVIFGPCAVILPLLAYHAPALGIYPILSASEIIAAMYIITRLMLDQTVDVLHSQIDGEKLAEGLQNSLTMSDYVARHDGLTGLLNRRAFEDLVQTLRDQSPHEAVAIVMIDLDHFKAINDRHGHPAGDAVLRTVSDLADRSRRKGEGTGGKKIAARWGGEEFIIALYDCTFDQALAHADFLRARLAQHCDPAWPAGLRVTASLGVAPWFGSQPLDDAIAAADMALYRAKGAGRNRVFAASSEPLPPTPPVPAPAPAAQAFTSA